MPSRHRSRERALQVLFQWDLGSQPLGEAVRHFYESLLPKEDETQPPPDRFMEELAQGVVDRVAEIDAQLAKHSAHWRLERMTTVDRNILRLAVYELLKGSVDPAIAIDEALKLARRFSGEESVAFVNGVLDAVRKELKAARKSVG